MLITELVVFEELAHDLDTASVASDQLLSTGWLPGMLRPRGQPGLEAKLDGLGLTMVGLGLIR